MADALTFAGSCTGGITAEKGTNRMRDRFSSTDTHTLDEIRRTSTLDEHPM